MNIKVNMEKQPCEKTGGGYAVQELNIYVDPTLPVGEQVVVIFHEIIENYFRCFPHDILDEVTSLFEESFEQLDWKETWDK